jgi:hypothetical protein
MLYGCASPMSSLHPHGTDRAAVAAPSLALALAGQATAARAVAGAPSAELDASVIPRVLTIGATLTVNGSFRVEGGMARRLLSRSP